MADIFISYAKKDQERVKPLAKALEKKGWTVWWDQIIPTGKDFDEVIEEELSKSRCVIVIWTKASVKSKYVKGEAREALNRGILVPIEIESGIKPPFDFRSIQTLSLNDWDGSDNFSEFKKLIADIVKILGEPPVEEQKRQQEEEERKAKKEQRRKQEEEQKLREKERKLKEAARKAEKESQQKEAGAKRKAEAEPRPHVLKHGAAHDNSVAPFNHGVTSAHGPETRAPESGETTTRGFLLSIVMIAAQLGTIIMIGMVIWGLANNNIVATLSFMAAAIALGFLAWKIGRTP